MNSVSQTSNSGGRRLRRLAETLQTTMTRYGYDLVETPIVQPAELFLTKAGDRLVTRLFTFERHGKQLALRPEFTATAAHDYVHRRSAPESTVARWQYSGPIFIEESDRSDLQYPQYSLGAELIGLAGPLAEAEIMTMAVDGITNVGIEDWTLHVGHVGLMRRLLRRFNLDARTVRILLLHLDELKTGGREQMLEYLKPMMLRPQAEAEMTPTAVDSGAAVNTQQMLDALLDATQRNITMGGRTRHDIVRRLLDKRQRAADYDQIVAGIDFLVAWGAIDATPAQAFDTIQQYVGDDAEAQVMLDGWRRAIDLLEKSGLPASRIRIQPNLSRSWDYYTGIVFEVYAANGNHLAGGGRYDELTALVGGSGDVPAAGFVYYPDQMLEATETLDLPTDKRLTLVAAGNAQADAVAWAQRLRSAGISVTLYDTPQPQQDAAVVTGDGSLQWRNTAYTANTLDQLLDVLKRA